MTAASHIQENLGQIDDPELRDVCLRIAGEVSERVRLNKLGLWTIDVISEWLAREPGDSYVIRGIQLLVAGEETHLLDMHFIFFDSSMPDDVGERVDDDEVREALRTGFLVHPVSGEKVTDFEDGLLPYFTPAQEVSFQ